MSMIVLTWYRNSLEMKRSYWILIFSLVSDDGVDDDDEKVDGVDGDVDVWGSTKYELSFPFLDSSNQGLISVFVINLPYL